MPRADTCLCVLVLVCSWGGYSSGALGLGKTPDVSTPQEVKFGLDADSDIDASKKFCFAIAASGWHSTRLVSSTLDLRHTIFGCSRQQH